MIMQKKIAYPSILLVQGGLHPTSHAALLLEEACRVFSNRSAPYDFLDFRSAVLDICDGRQIEQYGESTKEAIRFIKNSNVLIFSVPAYAPKTPGTLKNLIALSSSFLYGKRAGLICYSETGSNYEASLDVIKLLSAQSVEILKPVVRATQETFRNENIFDDVVLQLIEELVDAALFPPYS